MPTQEERLTALEQKTAAHIQEMDENFTIMVGVIRHQGQDIKRIFQRLETMDESLNTLNQRLETVDESLNTLKLHLNQRLETVDKRLETIERRLDRIETSFDEHTTLLTQILARLPKAP
jgi:DNA repair exonuclease SbcCD ATPase subunit